MALSAGTDRLRDLLDIVVASVGEPELRGGDVARRAFLSRFHFDRLVASAIGEPPGALRRRLLLERAAHQLRDDRAPVSAVAYAAGYGSPEAFSRAFHRAFGHPPSDPAGMADALDLPSPNGIHFHPPGGIRLPAHRRRTPMDVLVKMLEHDAWLIGEMLERAPSLDSEQLDQPIHLSVEGLDDDPSLRGLLTHLVWQKEMWIAAVEGRQAPDGSPAPIGELRERHGRAAPVFLDITRRALQEGRADETFIDMTCDPPHSFTYAGMIAHVLNFAAYRRMLALGALASAGITDLGAGDPSGFVAGAGAGRA